jgi:hypothetical protein
VRHVAAPLDFCSSPGDWPHPVVAWTCAVLLVQVAVVVVIPLLLEATIGRRPGIALQPPVKRLFLESLAGVQRRRPKSLSNKKIRDTVTNRNIVGHWIRSLRRRTTERSSTRTAFMFPGGM